MRYNKISQNAKDYIFWLIMSIYIVFIIILILLNYALIYFSLIKFSYIVYGTILVSTILTMLLVSTIPDLIEESFGYFIDDKKVESKYGIFIINRKIVLIKNVYRVSVSKNILSRIFGISTLVLSTSAGDVKIYLLDESSLESLYTKISRKIEN